MLLVYVEYINKKLIWRFSAKDWSLEMYNEKTRQPVAFPRTSGQNGAAVKRDIPMSERYDAMQPRRRCDGTLRNSVERPYPSDCAEGRCGGWGLEGHPLAMVYSPCQAWRNAYAPDMALSRGTLFAELDLPFEGSKCRKGCM